MQNFRNPETHPNVNFIKHHRAVHDRLIDDPRITAQHITLYFALFRSWNRLRFRTPMPIVREDLMHEARIGSIKTYTNKASTSAPTPATTTPRPCKRPPLPDSTAHSPPRHTPRPPSSPP